MTSKYNYFMRTGEVEHPHNEIKCAFERALENSRNYDQTYIGVKFVNQHRKPWFVSDSKPGQRYFFAFSDFAEVK